VGRNEAVLLRATDLMAQGRARDAVDLLQPLTRTHPDDAAVWDQLAAALLEAGRPEESLDAARRAAMLDSRRDRPHRLASLALGELGRHPEAVLAAREAVRLAPQDWRCHVTLAEALVGAGAARVAEPEEAVLAAREAVRLAPDQPRAYEALGDAALLARRLGEAEHAYRTVLRLDPQAEDARANLATVHRLRRRGGGPAPTVAVGAPEDLAHDEGFELTTWQVLRRAAVVLTVGSVVSLLAAYPDATRWQAVWGLVVCALVVGTLARFVLRLPAHLRPALLGLGARRPLLGLAALVSLVGLLLLLLWTAGVALGGRWVQPAALAALVSAGGWTLVVLGRSSALRRTARAARSDDS